MSAAVRTVWTRRGSRARPRLRGGAGYVAGLPGGAWQYAWGVPPGGRAGQVDHARLGDQGVRAAASGPRLPRLRCGPRPACRRVRGARLGAGATQPRDRSARSTLQTTTVSEPARRGGAAVSSVASGAISWRGSRRAGQPGRAAVHRGSAPNGRSPAAGRELGEQRVGETDLPPSTTGHRRAVAEQQPDALVTGALGGAASVRGYPGVSLGLPRCETAGPHRGGGMKVNRASQRMPGHGPERGGDLRQVSLPDQRAERPPGRPRGRGQPRSPRPGATRDRRPAGGRTRPWGCTA